LVFSPTAQAAADWYQVNEDGFTATMTTTASALTSLVVFDGVLYASNEDGVFQMRKKTYCAAGDTCIYWAALSVPGSKASSLVATGGVLYQWDYPSGQLWYVPSGADPATATWTLVTSTGVPGGSSPCPWIAFNGWVFATRWTSTSFEIYRSPHLGQATMTWTKVGTEGLGDPTNNQGVAFMIEYDGRLVIGTNTLRGMFGAASSYTSDGVEVWASTDRAGTSFSQINVDGFGTLHPACVSSVCYFPTNQVIGSAAVYKAPGETKASLYVGTKSHFGGEIWRWDGSSWTNVSQPWSCVGCLMSTLPHFRNEDMIAAGGLLYVAEGYPSADLATFDGSSWSIVESGPAPFDSMNNGLFSLAAINNIVYVATKRSGVATTGAQVWAGPFRRPPTRCSDLLTPQLPDLHYDPPEINWVLPEGLIELRWRLVNIGTRPSGGAFPALIVRDGEVVFQELIPWLEPGEAFEHELSIEIGAGEHTLSLLADPEGEIEDAFAGNNTLHLLIHGDQDR